MESSLAEVCITAAAAMALAVKGAVGVNEGLVESLTLDLSSDKPCEAVASICPGLMMTVISCSADGWGLGDAPGRLLSFLLAKSA